MSRYNRYELSPRARFRRSAVAFAEDCIYAVFFLAVFYAAAFLAYCFKVLLGVVQ